MNNGTDEKKRDLRMSDHMADRAMWNEMSCEAAGCEWDNGTCYEAGKQH